MLLATAVAAVLVPALRAAHVEPTTALRYEWASTAPRARGLLVPCEGFLVLLLIAMPSAAECDFDLVSMEVLLGLVQTTPRPQGERRRPAVNGRERQEKGKRLS